MRSILVLMAASVVLVAPVNGYADPDPMGFWEEVSVEKNDDTQGFFARLFGLGQNDPIVDPTAPKEYREFTLDIARLRNTLEVLKPDDSLTLSSVDASAIPTAIITIPEPSGAFREYVVTRTNVLPPELTLEYPEIATYRGRATDGDGAGEELRFEITPLGFQAAAYQNGQQTVIVPTTTSCAQVSATSKHSVYLKANSPAVKNQSVCRLNQSGTFDGTAGTLLLPELEWGSEIRILRLAVAATAEYTRALGGTKACAMSGIAAAVNRVNQIFERDLAVSFELVSNQSKLIFEDSTKDPFSNDDIDKLIGESQQVIDSTIGDSNYDVGHTFSTFDGGQAWVGAGQSGVKASGVSGSDDPSNDDFYVSFFAHELAHQFGGNHTFNSLLGNCSRRNWNRHTAFEPGSGSTILSYAGSCHDSYADDNVTNASDPYFHNISLLEMTNYISSHLGKIARYNSTNSIPTVDAGHDYVVPIGTPFYLSATAQDTDGDQLTYVWEQLDRGSQTSLYAGDNGASPLFRSSPPRQSTYREFGLDSSTIGVIRPALMRYSNFRVTVRDNHNSGQQNFGATASDTVSITFDEDAGPFKLVRPSVKDKSIKSGKYQVEWGVSGTDGDAVGAKTIDILASSDGGVNYDLELALNTPNDGAEEVEIPNNVGSLVIEISSPNNVFFDRSYELNVKP